MNEVAKYSESKLFKSSEKRQESVEDARNSLKRSLSDLGAHSGFSKLPKLDSSSEDVSSESETSSTDESDHSNMSDNSYLVNTVVCCTVNCLETFDTLQEKCDREGLDFIDNFKGKKL